MEESGEGLPREEDISRHEINEDENKIVVREESEYKIARHQKRKKKNNKIIENDETTLEKCENEKIVLFENNEIVEYDATNFRTGHNHIVLLEEDYLSVLEYLIEKKFYPDLHKFREDITSGRDENGYDHTLINTNPFTNYDHYSPEQISSFASPQGRNRNYRQISDFSPNEGMRSCSSLEIYPWRDANSYSQGNNYDCQGKQNNLENTTLKFYSEGNTEFHDKEWKNQFLCIPEKKYKLVTLANGKRHKINLNMNLRDFQKKYTSEDNKSFEYLLRNMKNKNIQKNMYSLIQRDEHNKRMKYIEECTKKGINCYQVSTNKSENELNAMMFSSNIKLNLMDNCTENKLQIYHDNTRFSKEYCEDIKKQIKECEQIRELKLLKKMKESKEDQMVEQGKFNLLSRNNKYEYVRTPVIHAGKGVDKNPIITWGIIASTPILVESEDEEESEDNSDSYDFQNKTSGRKGNRQGNDEDDGDDNYLHSNKEFNLQKINDREITAHKLQDRLKNIKYNKELLKKKNLNILIHKNYSSRMSNTSFRNSVLSRESRKRLNELALKWPLASQILKNKKR
ncbi:ES2 protein [Plasmodium gonderi]|uniref:ES2 protein n=1 Tax=Plasmodium gonderi TaxID=77519 RepID=A0A1Y1JF54_PLAGO|nr:ES2 protein [Plasmodium gonderi]GAW80880.1 ES2 protein [Plasmodium gonderi]